VVEDSRSRLKQSKHCGHYQMGISDGNI
jgi:hypothetical protein